MTEHILEMFILKEIFFFLKGAVQARETAQSCWYSFFWETVIHAANNKNLQTKKFGRTYVLSVNDTLLSR